MKLFAVLLGALALVAGFTGGLRAYSASSHAGPPVPAAQVRVHHYPPAQVVRPGPVVKWAPCVKPSVRVGRACVTHVTRTVTLAPPTSAPSTPVTTSATQPRRHTQAPSHPTSSPSSDDTGHHDDGGHDDGGGDDGGGDD
jgi:hypothetical protein